MGLFGPKTDIHDIENFLPKSRTNPLENTQFGDYVKCVFL